MIEFENRNTNSPKYWWNFHMLLPVQLIIIIIPNIGRIPTHCSLIIFIEPPPPPRKIQVNKFGLGNKNKMKPKDWWNMHKLLPIIFGGGRSVCV